MKSAVIYARVSSREQAEGFSIDAQVKACQSKANDESYKVLKIFKDEGFTGTNTDRPALKAMINYCKNREVSVVIVHKIDRFARSIVDHSAIRAILMRSSTNLISCTEQLGTAPHEIFLENIMASMAQYYSDNLKTEVKKGKVERFEKGYHQSVPPLGYHVPDGQRVMEPIPEMIEPMRAVFHLYNTRRYSLKNVGIEIAKKYGIKTKNGKPLSKGRVQEILRNVIYAGMVEYRSLNRIKKGLHEPIVTMDTFQKAQEIMEERGNVRKTVKGKFQFIYKGFVRCPECGNFLQAGYSKGRTKKYLYYFCRDASHKGINIRANDINLAFQKTLMELRIDAKIMKVIDLHMGKYLRDTEKLSRKELRYKEKYLESVKDERMRLYDRFDKGLITEEIYRSKDYELEANEVGAQIKMNETCIDYKDILTQLRMLVNFGSKIDRYWEIASFDLRVKILNSLFLNRPKYKDLNLFEYEISPLYRAVMALGEKRVRSNRGYRTRTDDLTLPKRAF